MPNLLDAAGAVDHRPDIGIFVGAGHYGYAPMVEGLQEQSLELVSKLCGNAVLWVPYTGPPAQKYAGHFDRARIPDLPAVDLQDEGRRLHHAQLLCKPFKLLLRVVFVLDADAAPEAARPVTLFATDPKMAPKRIYRMYRDRFRIEFNFRDAKQHLGLAACQARTEARHHFHVNAVLAALAWIRLELRRAAHRVLDHFSMTNAKLRSFLELVLRRLLDTDELGRTLQNTQRPCRPCLIWAKSSRSRLESAAHLERMHLCSPHPDLRNPGQVHRNECPCPCISRKLFTPLTLLKPSKL